LIDLSNTATAGLLIITGNLNVSWRFVRWQLYASESAAGIKAETRRNEEAEDGWWRWCRLPYWLVVLDRKLRIARGCELICTYLLWYTHRGSLGKILAQSLSQVSL